jgi:aspartyl-tRNA(Asn)/glutamyl-tRNA(Gln) amidotransferase subunit A
MGLASIGTDTGGSIRIPSAACGIVGLKPSAGEIPMTGIIPLSPSLDHAGPMARSVRDAVALYQVLAGTAPAPMAAARLAGLRLVQVSGHFSGPLEPDVRTAFDAALSCLRKAGVLMSPGVVPSAEAIAAAYIAIVLPEAAAWHAPYIDSHADGYLPTVRDRILAGRAISPGEIQEAHAVRAQLCREVSALLDEGDALVLPTMPIVAPPIGASTITPDPGNGASLTVRAAMLKHTQLFNLTGHPAISLPIATAGLPVGLQLVGRFNETPRLLEVALACEAALAQASSTTGTR